MKFKRFLSLFCVLALLMGLGVDASAAVEGQYVFRFYDNNGELVKTVETAMSSGNPTNTITKTELNLMPDFIDDGETVVITWKLKGGPDEAYDLLKHLDSSNPLTSDVELEPLRTMPTEELFSIAAIDCHADTTQAVINDGDNNWLPKSFNDLGVAPSNPPAKHPGDFSDAYGSGRFPVEQVAPRDYGGQALFPYMKQGGQSGALFTAFTGAYGLQDTSRGSGDLANSKALAMIYALHLSQANNSDDVELVTDVAGFQEAFDAGKIGIMQFVESAYCLTPENYYELLEQYYDLGIRGLSFTWNSGTQAYGTSTAFATALGSTVNGYAFTNSESPVARANTSGSVWGSAWPEIHDGVGEEVKTAKDLSDDGQVGLTALGEKALARMYELGMFYDGVHQHTQTVLDAIHASDNPILVTHADNDQFRDGNQLLLETAAKGGVFCKMFNETGSDGGAYSIVNNLEKYVEILMENGYEEEEAWNHVALGSDMDGGVISAGVSDSRYYFRIAKEMFARDYPVERIEKVLHGNVLRVIDEVQSNATLDNRGGSAVISNPMADEMSLSMLPGYGNLEEGNITDAEIARLTSLTRRDPVFSADVSGAVSGRVILDGLVVPSELSDGKLTASLEGRPVQEKWHVVTFEATDSNDKVTRCTEIFYTGHLDEIHRIEFVDQNDNQVANLYVKDGERIQAEDLPTETESGRTIVKYKHWWTGEEYELNDTKLLGYDVRRSCRLVAVDELGQQIDDIEDATAMVEQNGEDITVVITDDSLTDGASLDVSLVPTSLSQPVLGPERVTVHENADGKFEVALPDTLMDGIVDGTEYVLLYEDSDAGILGRSDAITLHTNYTVTFDANGGSVSPESSVTNADGKLDELPTPTRSGSYRFDGWFTEKSGGEKITADTVFTANTTIYAHWTYTGGGSSGGGSSTVRYTITVKQSDGGKIAPETTKVKKGENQTFTITADKDYVIADVLVDGKSVGAVGTYTFKNVTATHTIQAVFEKQEAPAFQFSDVNPNGWAAESIYFLYDRGVVSGVGDNLFAPTRNITRAEFVRMLAGLSGVTAEELSGKTTDFTDVVSGSWYEPYVAWAVENGVTSGTSETTFAPNANITREQMATMIYRYAGNVDFTLPETEPAVTFSDASSFSGWAVDAIGAMQRAGIISGVGDNRFAPADNATREQACRMLAVFLQLMEK